MAGIEREMEVVYVPPGNQSQIPPPQNPNLDSVSVEVENSDLPISGQPLNEASLVQNKRGSFFSRYIPIPKPLYYLICRLLFVCLVPIAYACVTIATVVILVLLIVALVVLRLLQLFRRWESIERSLVFKYVVWVWISAMVILLLLEVGIFYQIAKYCPKLKLVMLLGLPIAKWITIICTFIGIHLLTQLCCGLIFLFYFSRATRLDTYVFIAVLVEAPCEIIHCLLFWWAEVMVMNDVPTFKQSKILGVNTQRWIEGILIFLIAHNLISLITHLLVLLLIKIQEDESRINNVLSLVTFVDSSSGVFIKRYVVYIADGIKSSVTFILTIVMLLLTWVLYLEDHLNTSSQGKSVMQLGTRTLVTVLICSFLWLIKSCVLLYWEANVVYDRLHSKFTDIGKQLYFLVLLSYTHFQKAVDVESRTTYYGSGFLNMPDSMKAPWVLLMNDSIEGEISEVRCRKKARLELINHVGPKASIFALYDASASVLGAQYALSKDSISCDVHHLQTNKSEDDNEDIRVILEKIVQPEWECDTLKDDWKLLLEVLGDVQTTEEISFLKVKTWMERAHDRCRFLANTLISEKEVANCLNQILSGIIIMVTFIMWLLLTELATTKILVLVASPILAGTFIFGDSCKTLFQGLIFVYIVHPVGVGDLCVVDGKLLEVKRIGVWCTIFSEVRAIGKQEDIIFPNSELAVKNIINCKTEFDWKDYIEFTLCSQDLETTQNLVHQIQSYLDTEKERFTPNFHSVEFLEIGEKDKIGIHIKYNAQTKDWTYFECLKEKERRRLEFSLYLRNLLNQMESQKKSPELLVDLD